VSESLFLVFAVIALIAFGWAIRSETTTLDDVCVAYGGSLSAEACTFPDRKVPLEVTE
jgi:hypothetical protein